MNQKRNTIIAIIFTILVIGVFIFASVYSMNKTSTRADKINEQLRKENASWIAKDYPAEIMEIPLVTDFYSEDYNLENKIFSVETEKVFFPKETDLNLKPEIENKNKLTGFLFLETKMPAAINFKLNDKITYKEYMTPGKNQKYCGSCRAFATLSAMEGYINKKYNYIGKNRFDLSEQYLISYSNFMGCGGTHPLYYLNLVTLSEFDSKTQKLDDYLKNKIKIEINNSTKKHEIQKLKTKTQLSFAIGEVPFGVPAEKQLKYVSYDSCEIIKLDKSQNPTSGMDISIFSDIFKTSELDSKFCPDGSDRDYLNSPVRYKYTVPEKKDELLKYFVEGYFEIENKDCKQKDSKTIENIKTALKYTPVTTSISFYDSMKNYYQGVWEKTEVDKNETPGSHAVVIVGWGIEETRHKEYWIIKNSFGDTWGGDGYFRVWIQDTDLNLECKHLQGFYGELITKSGKEINALLPIAKEEIEQVEIGKQELEKIRQEELQRQQDNKNLQPIPNFPNDFNPLNEYFPKNISYSDIENITNNDCLTITNCIYNKLNTFFNINNKTDNRLT